MSEAKVTLAHKKNIRDAEAQKPAQLAKIKAATGVDYEIVVEPSMEEFCLNCIKAGAKYHERVGDAFYKDDGYVAAVATLLEKHCKDSMIKEAVVEATSAKKIVFRLNDKVFNEVQFMDGCLVVLLRTDMVYYGIANIPNIDITKLL